MFVSGTYDRYDTQYHNGISYDKYEYQGPTMKLEAPIDYNVGEIDDLLSDDEDEPMGDGSDSEFEPDEDTESEDDFSDDEDFEWIDLRL